METLLGPEDRAVLTGAFAEYMLACEQHGLAPGVDGWVDDDLAFLRPWGFDVERDRPRRCCCCTARTTGSCPSRTAAGSRSASRGVEARIDPADGHLTLLERRMREVNEWLLSHS